jgi:prepilin-type N-terminal cleavage/methylation domain-containing protein
MNKSFTLIEILVVIVVIGIISSFIIVGLSSVSDKANIAKGQAFSNSLRNSLLMNLVSEWKLDGNANDSWGVNNGTWNGSAGGLYTSPSWRTSSECVSGGCLAFDGTDDYLEFGDILDIGISDLTISIWAKINSLPFSSSKFLIGKSDTSIIDGRYAIGITSDRKVRAIFDPLNGTTVDSIKNVSIGWNFITVVWDRDDNMKIYLNGSYENQVSISSGDGINFNNGLSFLIGSYMPTGYFFEGTIDNAIFFFEALSSFKIKQNYFIGINKLYKNNGIVLNELNQRLTELKFNLVNNE